MTPGHAAAGAAVRMGAIGIEPLDDVLRGTARGAGMAGVPAPGTKGTG